MGNPARLALENKMPNKEKIEAIKVTPLRFDRTGLYRCKDGEAEVFSVTYLGTEPSYGKGWFPAYDKAMRYKYSSRVHAEAKAQEFADRYGIRKEQSNAH